tara:strand:+ start:914 stop:2050 length:1137 start_codon:yes stop_codon:yes gene_type:complete
MSNLLKEAIVDATALRETALKHAETEIIDKYSNEVRQTLEKLLEQEGLGLGADFDAPPPIGGEDLGELGLESGTGGEIAEQDPIEEDVEDVPFAATDGIAGMKGKNLKGLPDEGESVEVELNLGALRESVEALQAEIDEDLEFNEDDLAEILSDDEEVIEEDEDVTDETVQDPSASKKEFGKELKSEDVEISDEFIDSIVEKLTVDMGADLSGWAGRPADQVKREMEKELAHRRSTDVEEELKNLKKAQEELVFENRQLKEQLSQYKHVTLEIKESLQGVNLSNARLLYTNRVLRNTSLNERQKTKIADAISKAGSVAEAKTIYNTLESTVAASPSRGPQSLSEAISRPSSVIRATRKESAQPTDPFSSRMRQLAGIK